MMNDKIRMLLVEDEQTLADIIADTLGEKEFDVTVAYNGADGLRRFDERSPAAVVTDSMLPRLDGFSFVDALRRRSADVPILFLSARSAVDDVIHGFETGGNDYLRKPFAMSELVVRVKALVGRNRVARQRSDTHYRIGRFEFDVARQRLNDGDHTQELSAREADILKLLCEHADEVVPTPLILQRIWGDDSFFNARSLHVFITRLRRRLSSDPSVQIVNARGVGYKLLR